MLRHGSVVLSCDEWRGQDVIYSSDKVYTQAEQDRADLIVYDSIGVGAGVKAQLRRKTGIVQAVGFNAGGEVLRKEAKYIEGKTNGDMFSNIKAQSWWHVRDRFFNTWRAINHGDVFPADQLISLSSEIKDLEYLKAELSRPRVDYDNNGRVKVESKKDLKKRGIPSPNKADALIMAFAPIKVGMSINSDVLKQI